MPKTKTSATMRYLVPMKVRRPKLDVLPSVAYLDIAKLAQAENATVELGSIQSGCCPRRVSAHIRNGKVASLEVQGCPDSKPPTPEIRRLLKTADKSLGGSGTTSKFRPVPVADFFRNGAGLTIDIFVCIEICFLGYCLLCCIGEGGNGCAIFTDPL